MKIAVFTPCLRPGALGKVIPDISKKFVTKGDEIHLYTGEISAGILRTIKARRIKPHIIRLPANDPLFLFNCLINGLRFRDKPDVLLAWEFPSNIAAALAKSRVNVPMVWFCQEPSKLLYEEETLRYIKAHRPFYTYLASLFLRKMLRPIDKWAAASANVILANSKYTKKCVWQAYRKKGKVVHTSIDHNVFRPKTPKVNLRKKFEIPSNTRLLFCPGRLYPQKRVDIAVKTLAILSKRYDKLMLVISGVGPEEPKLKKLAEQLGVSEKIKFVGLRSTLEVVDLYNSSEVVLFPSINEPWGFVPLEAMACRKPVVAFKCGGPVESIVHRKTGLLVKEIGDIEVFARAVEYLLENPKICREMGERGRQRSKLFSPEKTFFGLSRAIEKVVA